MTQVGLDGLEVGELEDEGGEVWIGKGEPWRLRTNSPSRVCCWS